MLRTTLLLLLSLFTQDSFSQFYIKGKVVDVESQQPLKGASVYINNSTRGTTTDDKGEFQLGPFDPGRYEVVASFVGYEAVLYSAEIKTSSYRISFELDKKGTLLGEVLVLPDALRKKYLEILKKNVLGFTKAAEQCTIRNLNEIEFVSGSNIDEILAYTENELVIDNPDLGYTIYFELVSFYYNRSTFATYFFGYTRFVDLAKDGSGKKKFLRNRRKAYEGSTMHFFRSLINKQLEKEGFVVYQIINQKQKDSLQKSETRMAVSTKAIQDSMLYLYSDSLYKIYELRIGDGWRIIYNSNTDLKIQVLKKDMGGFQPPTQTVCGLRLKESPALLSEKGIMLTPMRLYYDGIWVYERLANMLPDDYVYEK